MTSGAGRGGSCRRARAVAGLEPVRHWLYSRLEMLAGLLISLGRHRGHIRGDQLDPARHGRLRRFWGYLWVSLLFGIVNAVIGTFLRIITFPLTVLTLGLFSILVNALLLQITDGLSRSLHDRRVLVDRDLGRDHHGDRLVVLNLLVAQPPRTPSRDRLLARADDQRWPAALGGRTIG